MTIREEELLTLARAGDSSWLKCSTSEELSVLLALYEIERLPKPFETLDAAWCRLNAPQREFVRRYQPQRSDLWEQLTRALPCWQRLAEKM